MKFTLDHYVVILAGGRGERFWPLSREKHPKQLLKLFHGKSLLQLAVERARLLAAPENILIITSPEHLYRAVRSFRKAGFMKVDGVPAFETAIESELSFDDSILGGNKWMPSIGKMNPEKRTAIINLIHTTDITNTKIARLTNSSFESVARVRAREPVERQVLQSHLVQEAQPVANLLQ